MRFKGFLIVLIFLVSCAARVQTVDRVVEKTMEHTRFQCFDGRVVDALSDCPAIRSLAIAGVEENKTKVQSVPAIEDVREIPMRFWFTDEESEITVWGAGTLRRSGDIFWNVSSKQVFVKVGDVSRSWLQSQNKTVPGGSSRMLSAFYTFNLTGDPNFDRLTVNGVQNGVVIMQRLEPFYLKGPIEWQDEYALQSPGRVESSSQSLRILKKEMSSNESRYYDKIGDAKHTVVLKLDTHYHVPFVVEEYAGVKRIEHHAFLFGQYLTENGESKEITPELVGLPKNAVILSSSEWQAYREAN